TRGKAASGHPTAARRFRSKPVNEKNSIHFRCAEPPTANPPVTKYLLLRLRKGSLATGSLATRIKGRRSRVYWPRSREPKWRFREASFWRSTYVNRQERAPMHCSNCHAEILDDSRFCSKCGKSIHPSDDELISATHTILAPTDQLGPGTELAGK